jgi:hypothetical protein
MSTSPPSSQGAERSPRRHDRVNNMRVHKATTRKRIRGRTGGGVLNTLTARREAPMAAVAGIDFSSLFGTHDDTLDDSDLDAKLIEVSKYSSSPSKAPDTAPDIDLERLDKALEPAVAAPKAAPSAAAPSLVSLAAAGEFLANLGAKPKLSPAQVAAKYGHQYPAPILSRALLRQRCTPHLDIVPQILAGKISTCYIYPMAKAAAARSPHATMSQLEKFEVDWRRYFGGYYGFERQSFIASLILDRYTAELLAAHHNKVVSYWTTAGFATFVLANEVIIRLIMADFGCGFERAEAIMRESTDYGLEVADATDFAEPEEPHDEPPEEPEAEGPDGPDVLDMIVNRFDSELE